MHNTKGLLSVTQAAREVSMTRQSFWQQIINGSVKAMKVGELYVIPTAEVRRVRQNRIKKLEGQLARLRDREKAGI